LAFVQSARRILAELRRLDEELDLLSSPDGALLSIGALPVAAAGMLPGVLKRLRTTYPRLKVRLQQGRTEDLLPLLATGEIEMIVGRLYEPVTPDGYDREALWSQVLRVGGRCEFHLFTLLSGSRPAASQAVKPNHIDFREASRKLVGPLRDLDERAIRRPRRCADQAREREASGNRQRAR
jgi:DNA-binding transcriptional LysR family regulator